MSTYDYGDPDDEMATELVRIADEEDRDGWLRADQDLVEEAAAVAFGSGTEHRALDVGAGTGRLLPDLLRRADVVVAVEPDASRFARLDTLRKGLEPASARRLTTVRCRLEDLRPTPFDLVLCSHVIQHIGTAERREFLHRLRAFGAPDAVCLITFSASGADHDAHYVSEQDGDHFLTREVNQADFDLLAARPAPRRLPVWHAGEGTVEASLQELGYTVLRSGAYRWFNHRALLSDGTTLEVRAADSFCLARF